MNVTATQVERRISRYAGRTAMAKPFDRYTPEIQQPVRDIKVKGDEKQRLKQAREMLRSMTPEQVMQIIEWHKNLTVFEALILAKQEGYMIVPNDVHDRILTETTDYQYLLDHYPVWTGTFAIYEAPNKSFGEKIVFTWEHEDIHYTIAFNIPKKYQGKKNCSLVVEHPDFDLEYLGNNNYELKVADKNDLHLLKNFPKEDGWHLTDDKHKIPTGKEADESNKHARYLWRSNNVYCGSAGRDDHGFDVYYGRDVVAGDDWSGNYVVAMVPLAAAASKDDTF